jgi:fructoselysine-6-phosphate deglycase
MLNFDPQRFLRIQSGALSLAGGLHQTIGDCLSRGARNIFFLGAGGAGILMLPALQLLHRHSSFPALTDVSAELVLAGHRNLGTDSIVVIPSLSGTTQESITALEHCKRQGATIISLTGHAGTPLADKADHSFVNFAEDDTSCESFYLQSLIIALSIMDHRQEVGDYGTIISELKRLPELLLELKREQEGSAERLAEMFRSEPYHIITGAGSTWPQAFYYGMCILEEMQWIRTRPVHASDFFHGTLELVEKGVSVIVLKGEDEGRALAERVEGFAPRYTDKVTVLDGASFNLPGISARVRALISPVLIATFLERMSAHLEVKRNHPLTTRRYYKRVAY